MKTNFYYCHPCLSTVSKEKRESKSFFIDALTKGGHMDEQIIKTRCSHTYSDELSEHLVNLDPDPQYY